MFPDRVYSYVVDNSKQFKSSVHGEPISTVVNFNVHDNAGESLPDGNQHKGLGRYNIWTSAPLQYDEESKTYSLTADISEIDQIWFNTAGIVPVTGLKSLTVGEIETDDFYTEDFIIDSGDAVECVQDGPYRFQFRRPTLMGEIKVSLSSEPYDYTEESPDITLNMVNRFGGKIPLSAEYEGAVYNAPKRLGIGMYDILDLYSTAQFKTDFVYLSGSRRVFCDNAFRIVGYENNYRSCAVQASSFNLVNAYVLDRDGVAQSIGDGYTLSDVAIWLMPKNTNLKISAQVNIDVDPALTRLKAYHISDGMYKLMSDMRSLSLSSTG